MKVLGVDYVYFPVSDLEKATAFYRDVLGMTPVFSMGGMWGELQAGDTTVALHVDDDTPLAGSDAGRSPSTAFACEDVAAMAERVREAGGKVFMEPFESGVCTMAVVSDLDGNSVMLHRRNDGTVG
jgi:predicted enzyme related to lactoylglutathione lyase